MLAAVVVVTPVSSAWGKAAPPRDRAAADQPAAYCTTGPVPSVKGHAAVFSALNGNSVVINQYYNSASTGRFPGCDALAAPSTVQAIVSDPHSITVDPSTALLIADGSDVSAWGARDYVDTGGPFAIFPGRDPKQGTWTTTAIDAEPPGVVYLQWGGCPYCNLGRVGLAGDQRDHGGRVAYTRDFEGANLSRAQIDSHHKDFTGYNFSHANLTGADLEGALLVRANLDGADLRRDNLSGAELADVSVDGADFTAADLRGATLTGLRYRTPPRFLGIFLGQELYPPDHKCTSITGVDLSDASFAPAKPTPGCASTPLLTDDLVPFELLSTLRRDYRGALDTVDFRGDQFLVRGRDRTLLAGADLNGIDLSGSSFVGTPVDFARASFDTARLNRTQFELADLSGAKLPNVSAEQAVFTSANLSDATFAGDKTDLQGANFVRADVSRAQFQGADLTSADFDDALAVDTDFNSVLAREARFSGAHIYGDGQAFDAARSLAEADFAGAVIAGNVKQGGFDFTGVDLTDARFDGAQCISCNFALSTLTGVGLAHAYLPGVVLSGVKSLSHADLTDAWLYCGDARNSHCQKDAAAKGRWDWPLALGVQEDYGPVPFAATTLGGVSLEGVTTCPDGRPPASPGCTDQLLPDPAHAPALPAPCSATALDACPTLTSTVFDAGAVGTPISLASARPAVWATTVTARGYYAGFSDGTVRLLDAGAADVVAGRARQHCSIPTAPCGDGGAATQALLGTPAGLAVGPRGFVYVADPTLHRVRRFDVAVLSRRGRVAARRGGAAAGTAGTIATVAGDGANCAAAPDVSCGDGGPATAAALSGPYGVWVDPRGDVFIADGRRGIREVLTDDTITSVGPPPGSYDVRSVVGGPDGSLYAATVGPDYILKIDLDTGRVSVVVGTGTSGYNGNTDAGGSLLPGNRVQINHPGSLAMTLDGEVLFADTGSDLIRAYVPTTGHVVDDIGGLIEDGSPQGGFNDDGHYASQTELAAPQAVTATRGALVVLADSGNKRIRQIGPSPIEVGLQAPGAAPRAPRRRAPFSPRFLRGRRR